MLAQKPPGVRVAMRDNWTVLVHAMLESADAFGAKTPALAKLAASLEVDDAVDDDDDLDDDNKPPPVRKKKKTKQRKKGRHGRRMEKRYRESKKKAMVRTNPGPNILWCCSSGATSLFTHYIISTFVKPNLTGQAWQEMG